MSFEKDKICIMGDLGVIQSLFPTVGLFRDANDIDIPLGFFNYGENTEFCGVSARNKTRETVREEIFALVEKNKQKIGEAKVIVIVDNKSNPSNVVVDDQGQPFAQLEYIADAIAYHASNDPVFAEKLRQKQFCIYAGENYESSVTFAGEYASRAVRFISGVPYTLIGQKSISLNFGYLIAQKVRSAPPLKKEDKKSCCSPVARMYLGFFGTVGSGLGGAALITLGMAKVLTFSPLVIAAIASSPVLAILFMVGACLAFRAHQNQTHPYDRLQIQ